MTTNFTEPAECTPFLGAKRYAPLKTPSLKQELEECYAEQTYEERIGYELEQSEAKLEALKKLELEIRAETSETSAVIADRIFTRPSHMFSRAVITADGIQQFKEFNTIEEFHNSGDPLGTKIPPGSTAGTVVQTPVTDPQTGEVKIVPMIDGIPQDLHALGVRSRRHPRTVRKYVAALLAFFSNLETEYVNEDGIIFVKKLPVFYASREKLIAIEQHEFQEITNGNTNFLPRASFMLDSMEYDAQRQINKSLPVSSTMTMDTLAGKNPYADVLYAPSPYSFNCRMSLLTRGIDDALMIVEQIGSHFNPFYALNIIDNDAGIDSQVRLKLDGCTFEPSEQEEYSQNEVLTEINFTLYGNLFKGTTKEYLADSVKIQYSTI